jgi:radical SAM superfamily enzyme YgiQ (UPF0313 family)
MPLAVAYLTSFIKDKFNERITVKSVSIEDTSRVHHIIKTFKPDIVGLSTTTPGYDYAKELANDIKKIDKKIVVLAGGAHITLFPEEVVKDIDYAVVGEGEETLYELIAMLYPDIVKEKQNIKQKNEILGLIYWNEGQLQINPRRPFIKNLDDIGHPERRLLNPTNNTLFTSRGCPFNCVYCSSPIIWKRTFRMHSPKYMLEEIKTLYNIGHSVQWFADDLFVCNKPRIKELVHLMKEEKLLGKISFFALGRSNLIDEEMVQLLKQLNVMSISFGFETADNDILKYAKNGNITVEHHINASKLCRKYGILVDSYIMIGFPEDTHHTVMKTYKFIEKYSDTAGEPNLLMVFPKTTLNDELLRDTGINYSDIHLKKMKLTFGGSMPVTAETVVCKHLTPKEIEDWKKKFVLLGKKKMRVYYFKILLKLIFSKGLFMNLRYFYSIFITKMKNPKREFTSENIHF